MKDLEILISLIATIIGLLITVLTFAVKAIGNAKAKKIAEQTIKMSNQIMFFIRQAEQSTTISGKEKKAFVMSRARSYAQAKKISFNEEKVDEKIEELIALTKQVNTKGEKI